MDAVLLGYFPKQLLSPPDRLRVRGIEEIASVSPCIAEGPEGWDKPWKHNEWGFFANPQIALSVVPDDEKADYWLYACALFPIEYSEGGEEAMEFDAPDVTAVGSEYDLVGYDVVSRSGGCYFECSPLSCNMLAEATEANRYCLSSDLSDAR